MARIFVFNILFFLLPFLLYAGYLLATKGSFRNAEEWQLRTVSWLALGGAALMVAVLLIFANYDNVTGDTVYRPSQYIDGKIVPGELIRPGDEADAAQD